MHHLPELNFWKEILLQLSVRVFDLSKLSVTLPLRQRAASYLYIYSQNKQPSNIIKSTEVISIFFACVLLKGTSKVIFWCSVVGNTFFHKNCIFSTDLY